MITARGEVQSLTFRALTLDPRLCGDLERMGPAPFTLRFERCRITALTLVQRAGKLLALALELI